MNIRSNLVLACIVAVLAAPAAYPQKKEILQLQADMIRLSQQVTQLQSTMDTNNSAIKGLVEKMADQLNTLGGSVQKITQAMEGVKAQSDKTAGELRVILNNMNTSVATNSTKRKCWMPARSMNSPRQTRPARSGSWPSRIGEGRRYPACLNVPATARQPPARTRPLPALVQLPPMKGPAAARGRCRNTNDKKISAPRTIAADRPLIPKRIAAPPEIRIAPVR